MFKYLQNIKLRSKLLFTYFLPLIVSIMIGSFFLYSYIKKTIINNMENELKNSNTVLFKMVKTTINVSIKNYLRAIAVKNRDIVAHYYNRYKKGEFSEKRAKKLANRVLLSQKIGETGYIFVWDIKNAPKSIPLVVHPKIQGRDVAYVDFVQRGAKMKTGYIEYSWKNPDDKFARDKSMYLSYFKEWEWVIAVSSYRKDFVKIVNVEDFKDNVLSIKFGKSGYYYIIDSKGNIIIHPKLKGNYYNAKDPSGKKFIQEICNIKNGKIKYLWKNPGEKKVRKKIVVFNYISDLDWIIASSAYIDEFNEPIYYMQRILIGIIIFLFIIIIPLSFIGEFFIVTPLKKLMIKLDEGASGNYSVRVEYISKDEIGQLGNYFNIFMDKLNINSKQLISAKNYLNNIFNSLSSILIAIDNNYSVTEWNKSIEEFSGISNNNAKSKLLFELLPGEGTGLGLSMVYNTIEQHKGFITTYSEVGIGTTFNLFLPVFDEEHHEEEQKKGKKEFKKGSGQILIIDDEEIIRETSKAILEECGYTVFTAENGLSGIKIYEENYNQINLIILDLVMPVLSGKETYIKLKELNPEIKVLLTSGFKRDKRVKDVLSLGVNDFIQKPYPMFELSEKVYSLMMIGK